MCSNFELVFNLKVKVKIYFFILGFMEMVIILMILMVLFGIFNRGDVIG